MAKHSVGWVVAQKRWLLAFLVMFSLSTLVAFFIRVMFDTCDRGGLDVVDKNVPLEAPIGTSPSSSPSSRCKSWSRERSGGWKERVDLGRRKGRKVKIVEENEKVGRGGEEGGVDRRRVARTKGCSDEGNGGVEPWRWWKEWMGAWPGRRSKSGREVGCQEDSAIRHTIFA
ncbi:hypothetical protein D8674_006931 [Pyrus ussuriensis x Pyrus communis]|uniref:Uncharacterized protein n=1 Tax=Pyrus ussuriensis x Pyrus communis TaxID=2448454 RepID=A0A5N5G9A4_9ROSA|nr:hypothetical protein D8674_006931 [Pyrus ussuriensis x Pyrus communis]